MGIKVLSLYDGMACGMLALMEAGIAVDRYVAFEVDKYAVKTSSHNFPKIEHRGDVFKGDFTEFRGFNILMGGSPCTYWSIAQSNGRETEASGIGWELFSQYTRALKEAQPDYFIYENNRSMSNAIRDSIRAAFGFEEICINSALVSAQNRVRYYWVGKRNPDGTYSKVDVAQPEDMGILLRDVLDGAGSKALSEREVDYMVRETKDGRNHFDFDYANTSYDDKAHTVTANMSKGVPYNVLCERVGTYPVYDVCDGQITVKGEKYPIKLKDGYYIIRKMTVSECKRLQTVAEWYDFSCVSNTQALKMLGNGWTVSVIHHLLKAVMADWLTDIMKV